ncbi:MAG: desulfoferrodoxin, partial [Clostridia bacterium]|nr:desulfoferrodoxin [Clostridia bacterium]
MKFYVCKHCGNIITKLEDKGVPVVCCGEKMQELTPNTVDA